MPFLSPLDVSKSIERAQRTASEGGGGVTVDNQSDAPAEVTTLIAPGAVIAGDEATLPIPVLSRTTNLTNDQIKALPTTSVELVPAPGAGTAIMPLLVLMVLDTTAGYYDNVNAAAQLALGRAYGLAEVTGAGSPSSVSGLLQAGAPYYAVSTPTQWFEVGGAAGIYPVTGSIDDLQDPLLLVGSNGGAGNFTQGHASNVMKVTVLYIVVDI